MRSSNRSNELMLRTAQTLATATRDCNGAMLTVTRIGTPVTRLVMLQIKFATDGAIRVVQPRKRRRISPRWPACAAHEAAHGTDESPLITALKARSFSRQITFQQDITNKRVIARALKRLVETAAADAREEGYRAMTVTGRICFADFETLSRQVTLQRPSSSPRTIARAARECLEHIALLKKVRLIGVRLSGLVSVERGRRREPSTIAAPAA